MTINEIARSVGAYITESDTKLSSVSTSPAGGRVRVSFTDSTSMEFHDVPSFHLVTFFEELKRCQN